MERERARHRYRYRHRHRHIERQRQRKPGMHLFVFIGTMPSSMCSSTQWSSSLCSSSCLCSCGYCCYCGCFIVSIAVAFRLRRHGQKLQAGLGGEHPSRDGPHRIDGGAARVWGSTPQGQGELQRCAPGAVRHRHLRQRRARSSWPAQEGRLLDEKGGPAQAIICCCVHR